MQNLKSITKYLANRAIYIVTYILGIKDEE